MLHFMTNFSLCEAINTAKNQKLEVLFYDKMKIHGIMSLLHAECCRTQTPFSLGKFKAREIFKKPKQNGRLYK